MRPKTLIGLIALALTCSIQMGGAQDFAAIARTFRPKLETNLLGNIVPFWNQKNVDRVNGGYILNQDVEGRSKGPGTKMIVTQCRQLWLFSHLTRDGYGKENLELAENGYRFLKEKMWDEKNGGFYWEVDPTGNRKLQTRKHLYGQAFGLYALSEYYLASGKQEVLDLATKLFNVMEEKSHDKIYGGYQEWFNEDWTIVPPGERSYMDAVGSEYKLMNTHLHLLEAVATYYRASKSPLARERLLELITIQGNTVVRKGLGGCTDKFKRNWEPVLTGDFAKVSYGHDLENIWLLVDACDAAGISTYTLLDTYKTMFDYSLKYGFDEKDGGFFTSGAFNEPANNREKTWWVEAEALVSSLYMYRLTHDQKYLRVFEKTYEWVDKHQVDWERGEWYDTIMTNGKPRGDKAQTWKGGYHNGRSMMECLDILKAGN